MKKYLILILGSLLAVSLVSSCSDKTGGPNLPPETWIVEGPADGSQTSYKVTMKWNGSDSDGRVSFYEFAWNDVPVSGDQLDSLDWEQTFAVKLTFILQIDGTETGDGPTADCTFFVRSVDYFGERDPTPAKRSFTITTDTPWTKIIFPDSNKVQFDSLPSCVTIRWRGYDPDGEVTQYQYGLKYWEDPPRHQPPDHPNRWSDWLTDTELTQQMFQPEPNNPISFYVHCMDDAGVIEETFTFGQNAVLIYIDESKDSHPSVTICCRRGLCGGAGDDLGCRSSTNPDPTPIAVPTDSTLCFTATFCKGPYASRVTGIRFRYDVPDTPYYYYDANEPENKRYDHVAEVGFHTIYVWVVDDYCSSGSTAGAFIRIEGQ